MEHKIKIDNVSLISANIAVWSLVAILLLTTGCGTSTGWQVNFGVHPISAIDNHQQLRGVASNGGAIVNASQKDRY